MSHDAPKPVPGLTGLGGSMGIPTARVGDMTQCDNYEGVILTGAASVLADFIPSSRVTDLIYCYKHYLQTITTGNPSVIKEMQQSARVGDQCSCGAIIVSGSQDVLEGEQGGGAGSQGGISHGQLLFEGDLNEYFRNPELRASVDLSGYGIAIPVINEKGEVVFVLPDGSEIEFIPKHLPDPLESVPIPRRATEEDFARMQ